MRDGSPSDSLRSHASQVPPAHEPNPLLSLPEETILEIISHISSPEELLAFSCTCRILNRIGIRNWLKNHDIPNPAANAKLFLSITPDTSIDSLKVLLHSVHIKQISDLSFYYTRIYPYSILAAPLRRTLRLLRNLESVTEVTLYFGRKSDKGSKDEKHLKEMISIFEDIFNEMIIKSCKKIRVFGSDGLLDQFYEFRASPSGSLSAPARLSLSSVKGYLDRRQSKKIDDPIVLDDLRYLRTSVMGSRLFLRPSAEALACTKLTHLNFGTSDFLRPPFSQWIFPMLKASTIHSLSFSFNCLPASQDEASFMLERLASVLPSLHRLYLFDIKDNMLPTLFRWINMFPSIKTLQIEPSTDISDEIFTQLPPITQLTSSHEDQSDSFNPSSGPFSFASNLRRIDAPHQFLSYFFSSCDDLPPPAAPQSTGSAEEPKPPPIPFPLLDMIHLDYFCTKKIKFDPKVLASAVKRLWPLTHASPTRVQADCTTAYIVVHLKFDSSVLGQAPFTLALRPGHSWASEDLQALAIVDKLRLGMPGTREEIRQGKFDRQVGVILSLFKGVRAMRLASQDHSGTQKEEAGPLQLAAFKQICPKLLKVDLF